MASKSSNTIAETVNYKNFGTMVSAARVILGWSRDKLCRETGLGKSSIATVEDGHALKASAMGIIQSVLESQGIEFREGTTTICVALVNTTRTIPDPSMPLGYRQIKDRRHEDILDSTTVPI